MPATVLPQELRDKIQGFAIQDEIINVLTISHPEWREEVELGADYMAEMTEEELQVFWDSQSAPPEYTLKEVRLVFSPDLTSLLAEEGTRDQLMELVYRNCTVDLSMMTVYGKEAHQEKLKEALHRFRKVRVGLAMRNLAGLFDQIEYLGFLSGGYSWPMKEDTSATIWGRATKSLWPLMTDAVVDILRGDAYAPHEEPFRLVEDKARDEKAVAWARSVNGI